MYDRLLWWTDLSVCLSQFAHANWWTTDALQQQLSNIHHFRRKDTVHVHNCATTSHVTSGSSLNLCLSFFNISNQAFLFSLSIGCENNLKVQQEHVFLLSVRETCPLKPPDSECVQVKPHYLHGQVPLETMEKTCFHCNLNAAGQDIKYFTVKDLCFNYI